MSPLISLLEKETKSTPNEHEHQDINFNNAGRRDPAGK